MLRMFGELRDADFAEALLLLDYAQQRAVTEDERLRARYLLAEYGDPNAIQLQEGEEESIWGALIKETQETLAFEEEFKKWKEKSSK